MNSQSNAVSPLIFPGVLHHVTCLCLLNFFIMFGSVQSRYRFCCLLCCLCTCHSYTGSARLLATDSAWQRLQLREQLLLALLDAQVRHKYNRRGACIFQILNVYVVHDARACQFFLLDLLPILAFFSLFFFFFFNASCFSWYLQIIKMKKRTKQQKHLRRQLNKRHWPSNTLRNKLLAKLPGRSCELGKPLLPLPR